MHKAATVTVNALKRWTVAPLLVLLSNLSLTHRCTCSTKLKLYIVRLETSDRSCKCISKVFNEVMHQTEESPPVGQ